MRAEERPVESRNAKCCGDVSKHCAKDSQRMHYSFCAYLTEDGTLVSYVVHSHINVYLKGLKYISVWLCAYVCVCVLCVPVSDACARVWHVP